MKFNCFRSSAGHDLSSAESAPRRASTNAIKRGLKRQGTAQSTASSCSTISNLSISQLPPCRPSDPRIEAMMMPVPAEARPSRCLRLSQPRIYGDIVSSMKIERGCRNWRSFDVFSADEIDEEISAVDAAKEKAMQCGRKIAKYSKPSIDIDTIG